MVITHWLIRIWPNPIGRGIPLWMDLQLPPDDSRNDGCRAHKTVLRFESVALRRLTEDVVGLLGVLGTVKVEAS